MKNFICLLFLSSVMLFACGEKGQSENEGQKVEQSPEENQSNEGGSLEERAKRHVESILGIPGNENYSIKIYKEDLDGDEKKDAVITVNRYEFALDEAARSGNTAKRAELGFMGSYNTIFYYDGVLDKISPAINIPSTPQKELVVSFDFVSNTEYKDIIVDYRIRNAKYREYFFVSNHTPRRVFQCKIFDGLGTSTTEAFSVKYAEGTMSSQKDILILKAELQKPTGEFDEFTFDPIIIDGKELMFRFFYHPKLGKYAIQK